jgi:hypothetical protein
MRCRSDGALQIFAMRFYKDAAPTALKMEIAGFLQKATKETK